eukprot:4822527-Amphidinium_carterae.1
MGKVLFSSLTYAGGSGKRHRSTLTALFIACKLQAALAHCAVYELPKDPKPYHKAWSPNKKYYGM